MTQEALKLALEALECALSDHRPYIVQCKEAITAIKETLTQPEQEPVAYLVLFEGAGQLLEFKKGNYLHGAKVKHIPLYTKTEIEIGCSECGIGGGHALYCVACAEKFVGGYKESVPVHASELLTQVSTDIPPQRTWVGLTDDEIDSYFEDHGWLPSEDYYPVIKDIEAKLKDKNN
jgi:hypothetical protein